MRRSYEYLDVVVVAPDGRPVVHVPATAHHSLGARVQALIAEAERTGEVVSSGLYLGPDGNARFETVAPVRAQRPTIHGRQRRVAL